MISQYNHTGILKAVLTAVFIALLTACGGGENESTNKLTPTVVSGSVGDGPITGATVEIYNVKGELISTGISDHTAAYKSSFKVHSRDYPLFLKVSDGIDLVTGDAPDFELISVMMRSSSSTANINPFSTLIVKMAESMAGGVNDENINYANAVVMEKFSFGLDPNAVDNPVTQRISSKNIADIVKASEALGEMIRRTRDLISAAGTTLGGNDVINAIAADMADGFLDGAGAAGSDPTIAAVANVVTGQVLVEAMTNTLKVNGVIATVVIDQAISTTHSSVKASQMSDSVQITSGLINQTKLSVAAAQVVDSSARLTELSADIDSISAGSLSSEASKVLSADASQWLDNAVTMAATADTQTIVSINLVANNSDPVVDNTPPPVVENTPPKITGSPASAVISSNSYSFKPGATDADGDVLSFGIVNKPAWASFNATTGRLNGVPAEADVGDYKNIVITVSDGADAASLPAFNIQVDAEGESVRVTNNLVAFYPFVERSGNVVRDLSGSANSMDLAITGAVSWYGAGNGVVMNGGRVGTAGPSTELINALRASNSSSFEIWVEPDNVTQSGPARLVSVGGGTSKQNFMLGQVGDGVEVRFLHTGKQSERDPRLVTGNGVLEASLIHLVHTYDGAVERLYINGVQHSQTVASSGGYSNWDMSHAFSIGNEASSDRPYKGVVRMVAVYDRSLDTAEIQQNFAAGPAVSNIVGGTEGANYVPVISGTPAESTATDEGYDFQPAASDADGDTLIFSIVGKPAWANFDTATGRLSGMPTIGDVGTYNDIIITVTDSMDMASLAAFSIQVIEPVRMGSFDLNWTAPTLRSDGTPLSLSDINGYRIYYGEYEGNYTESVEIANGTAQYAKLTDIPVGSYYVVMSTYDVDGRESSFSNYVFKTSQ